MLPLITLEEHYVSPYVRAAQEHDEFAVFPPALVQKLNTLGEERVQDLDAGNVSLQIISHGPGDMPASVCTAANDDLASAISKYPTRLAGFALLPVSNPAAAASELERSVKDLGFVGALVDTHINGEFYDDEKFWIMFEKAQGLDVPIYIHPSWAAESTMDHYRGNYDESVAVALSAYGWGWHSDTALHILKLYASGLFDRFPKLKIIIGHMGELLPFQLDRIFGVSARWGRQRSFQEVWKENIWITTSGMFALPPLACLLQTTSIDHVLYSVDYPFSSNEKGLEFFNKIQESGLIAGEDLEKFAYRNAEQLLGVRAKGS
ncbi:metal-dependent hydrolase [Penicillium angulare]|uniref:Metal-dependent hydrolase n=1 Tax=Penicillium angulare TaxID=116970 RepID=A0A9W9F4E8_9EURO|nr:metal-dependent hydrolase [Penicillium angulare]